MPNSIIDLSHHNKISSFDEARADGIFGVLHKATQGATFVDPTYTSHRTDAVKAGLKWGAYHFGVAGDAIAQADHLLQTAGPGIPLVLDFEGNPQGQDMTLPEAEHFVHHLHEKTGRWPGLYSGHTLKEALAKASITAPEQTVLSNCWLWIAQYSAAPLIPKVWKMWTLWQYTDGAHGNAPHEVQGVGRCDRDIFNGTAAELKAFWKAQST